MTADLIRDGIVVYEKAKEKGDKDSVPFNQGPLKQTKVDLCRVDQQQ